MARTGALEGVRHVAQLELKEGRAAVEDLRRADARSLPRSNFFSVDKMWNDYSRHKGMAVQKTFSATQLRDRLQDRGRATDELGVWILQSSVLLGRAWTLQERACSHF